MKAKKFLTGTLIAGSVVALSGTANAKSLFNFSALGSGAEVRSELMKEVLPFGPTGATGGTGSTKMKDGKCGEGKCGDKKGMKGASGSKMKDGKCGDKSHKDEKSPK